MINFNNGVEKANIYTGVDDKTVVLYNNEIYMLKYPNPFRRRKLQDVQFYKNNQFSEHIGCEIFRSCGFVTQETVLGYFTGIEGKEKIVVGCKDFTKGGSSLHEIQGLAKQIKSSDHIDHIDKAASKIENVDFIINNCVFLIDKEYFKRSFWDMFVIDALIGNDDRHLGNWGALEKDTVFTFAPVYDCGSSLAAGIEDSKMVTLLKDDVFFNGEELYIKSCYSLQGKRIVYYDIFQNPPGPLAEATKRTVPKINMDTINNIITSIPELSDIRKGYLIKALGLRYKQILFPAYERIILKDKILVAFNKAPASGNSHEL